MNENINRKVGVIEVIQLIDLSSATMGHDIKKGLHVLLNTKVKKILHH